MNQPGRAGAQEVPAELASLLVRLRDDDDPLFNPVLARAAGLGWRAPTLAAVVQMKPAAVSKRIERGRRRRAIQPQVDALDIPAAPSGPHPPATMAGRQLSRTQVAELREKQKIASKVNGALPPGHPARLVGEAFSEELQQLLNEGFSVYYLARELGISIRAITSRLERHGYRDPCPSVADTPSGRYRNKKIGGPRASRTPYPQQEAS